MFAKPPKGASVLEDNATVHTPEFEEREECTVSHQAQAAQLETPTGIAVCQKVFDEPNCRGMASSYALVFEEEGM